MDGESYHTLYLREVQSELRAMEAATFALEGNPADTEGLIDQLFRNAHTIKGSSRAMGYQELANIMHLMESAFDEARHAKKIFTQKFFTLLFQSIYEIEQAVLATPRDGQPQLPNLKAQWQSYLHGDTIAVVSHAPAALVLNEDARIPFAHLERMMGVSEDLMHTRMRIEELGSALFGSMSEGTRTANVMVKTEYQSTTRQFHRLTTELEQLLQESRMIPLEQVFQGIPRAVRDLSEALHKTVALHIEGGDLRIDRTIVEHLGGTLLHLVRNAIDHGIAQDGSLVIRAVHEGEFVSLFVEDNGVGIQYDDVLSVARAKGIIAPEVQLSDIEKKDLIFHPDLSTTAVPTDISGRGVGLFSVKEYVRSVGGRVSVDALLENGQGTRFTLTLPISLALIRTLIIKSGHATFGIPVSQVADASVFDALSVEIIDGKETVHIGERKLPLLRLNDMLGLNIGGLLRHHQPMIIAAHTKQGDVALLVEQVVREEDVVVKPLPHLLLSMKIFLGATTLGDGRTVLILDPEGLLSIPEGATPSSAAATLLSAYEQDQLREIMNVVASHAGTAISRRLGLKVELSVPECVDGSLPFAETDWGASAVGIRIALEGAYPGHLLFEMPESMAQSVGKAVLGRDIILHELRNEDRAFFQELGTIAMHAVGNMLSRVSKNPVMTSTPDLRVDARGALRTYFLSGHGTPSGDLVRVRLWFSFGDNVRTDTHESAGSITMEFPRTEARALLSAMSAS